MTCIFRALGSVAGLSVGSTLVQSTLHTSLHTHLSSLDADLVRPPILRPFTPGPFNLGRFVCTVFNTSSEQCRGVTRILAEFLNGGCRCYLDDLYSDIHSFTGPVANINVGLGDVSGGKEKDLGKSTLR